MEQLWEGQEELWKPRRFKLHSAESHMSEYLVINEEVSELKWLPCRCFPQIRAHAEWSVALECILNDYNTDKTNHVQHLQWTRSWWWDKVQSPKLCRWNKGFTFPFKNWQIRANVHKSYRLQFITIFLHTGLLFSIKGSWTFCFATPSNVETKHIISAATADDAEF